MSVELGSETGNNDGLTGAYQQIGRGKRPDSPAMMIDRRRQRLLSEYGLIFEAYPLLKETALSYWKQVEGMDSVEEEELFNRVALKISDSLMDNPVFLAAMVREGKNPIERAIIESFYMIDIVLDI